MDRCRNGPGFHNDVDGNSTVQEIPIPASKVGLVIGKGGETIKQLQVRDPRPAALQRAFTAFIFQLGGFGHGSGWPELGWLCTTVPGSPRNLCPRASTLLNIYCGQA